MTVRKTKRKITQNTVAKAANVSQALVSLVLSGSDLVEVSPENRRKVIEAAQKLGYQLRRKPVAKTPSNLLAYVYPQVTRESSGDEWLYDSYEEFYLGIRARLEEVTQKRGYSLISRAVSDSSELTQWLSEWDIRGVFWNYGDGKMANWIHHRLPLVQLDRRLFSETDSVYSNQSEMIQLSLKHLVAKGHTRIAFISKFPLDDHLSLERTREYLKFTEAAGLPQLNYNTLGIQKNEAWMDEFLALLRGPRQERMTALIAPDLHCLLLQKRLLREGFSLPDDLSLVGIDNISSGNFVSPSLTSIDGEYREVAASAMDLMEKRIENPTRTARKIEISPRLIERESVQSLNLTPKDQILQAL